MLSSLDELFTNLSNDQFKETKKYLELFYIQQPSQSQSNTATEVDKRVKSMQVQNCPYQLPTLTLYQQQQIEEDLALITREGVYPYE